MTFQFLDKEEQNPPYSGLVLSYRAKLPTHSRSLQCINCSACSHFAPDTFERHGSNHHVVYQQPETTTQIEKARAALAACPVAAIRLETKASRSHSSAIKDNVQWSSQDEYLAQALSLRRPSTATSSTETQTYPFPRPVISQDNTLYFLGHHNEASFGATPYLLSAVHEGNPVWIMIDTPKYSSQAVQTLERILGNHEPDFLFLTHVDDTADHQKWKDHYPGLKRIFHEGDLGVHNWIGDLSLENVEVLLKFEEQVEQPYLPMYTLDGDAIRETDLVTLDSNVVILHTPGHSPGSITLYRLPEKRSGTSGILFTGDTYAFSTRTNKMSGFPRYGHDLHQQATTLQALLRFDWEFVAPGHGHCRDYIGKHNEFREAEIQDAIEELLDQ